MATAVREKPALTTGSRKLPAMRHVALLIETSRAYGRGLLEGIARFKREHGNWLTYCRPHGLGEPPPAWLKRWHGDGVLVRIAHQEMENAVARLGIPVVNLRGARAGFPTVGLNEPEVARLAAEHLLSRGFRHFGFCGHQRGYSPRQDERADAFREFVKQAGGTFSLCQVFRPTFGRAESNSWERQQDSIGRWITSLPKPAGIMTCNDDRGVQVLEVCRWLGLSIPEEVAVIGVDDDHCLCNLAIPPLTSVDVNAERIGYTAAAVLEDLMSGRKPPKRPILISPRGVVLRQSTDVVAVEDREIAAAIQYIRTHACEGIRVTDVLDHVDMSRTWLEQRLKQIVGRTLHQEIQHVRLERVRNLLATTNLPIKQIALKTGYRTVQYMTKAFRAQVGCPPATYRKREQHCA